MSRQVGISVSLLSIGTIVFAVACTFEPPGSVLDLPSDNTGADAGGLDDQADADLNGAPPETMSITFTTEGRGGEYDPANIVATWIEDEAGFVQTIDRKAAVRVNSLRAWNAVAGGDTDAVSGATRANHNLPITATWDIAAAALPDGIYTIRIETAETNANTPADNAQATFSFEKNGTAAIQNVAAAAYPNVTIDYSGRELQTP